MSLNNKSVYLIPVSVVILLAGFFLLKNSLTSDKISSVAENQSLDVNNQSAQSNLIIDAQKCIGCGRCAKTLPTNFQMDNSIKKAVVISSVNYNSDLVRQAINHCPVAAISLN